MVFRHIDQEHILDVYLTTDCGLVYRDRDLLTCDCFLHGFLAASQALVLANGLPVQLDEALAWSDSPREDSHPYDRRLADSEHMVPHDYDLAREDDLEPSLDLEFLLPLFAPLVVLLEQPIHHVVLEDLHSERPGLRSRVIIDGDVEREYCLVQRSFEVRGLHDVLSRHAPNILISYR